MRWTALIWALPILFIAAGAIAQDIDDLADLDEGVVLEEPFIKGIQPNTWGMTILFGYLNVSTTLLRAEGIIVDVEFPDEASFSDMTLDGELSFAPQLRLTRTIGSHFALELGGGFALGDYFQELSGDQVNWTDPDGDNEVTENELAKGSYWIWTGELSGSWYPRGEGTFQPYLIGGVGANLYDIDSAYIDGSTSSLAFSYGVGIRLIGDELYSIRIEARNYHASLENSVGSTFLQLPNLSADQLVDFPVSRLVDQSELTQAEIDAILQLLDINPGAIDPQTPLPVPYESYETETFSSLWVSIGFEATF
ncbi:hypothetical protein DRQ53_05515 [bacterium]|nr:MAG: hypothetical protein DRQ32_06960 [bacterium]RKZ16727.1 MAG: hypothetical protein DRQ53_05515 [bacterium]